MKPSQEAPDFRLRFTREDLLPRQPPEPDHHEGAPQLHQHY